MDDSFLNFELFYCFNSKIKLGESGKFPKMLRFALKKTYSFTICLTKENLKEGSKVYKATEISEAMDITGNHSPEKEKNVQNEQTQMTNVSFN